MVTHYGKNDDTRLFSSGGVEPALIKDPGEYTALPSS
jgi:hypothetical protein